MLVGKKKPPTYVALSVRGKAQPPTLLSPRNSKILSDSPTFHWMGMDQQPGTVKVFGPQGEIWSAQNINLTKIAYPATAPRLQADVEYGWSIEKKGVAASKTTFKLLGGLEAQAVKERLAELGAMRWRIENHAGRTQGQPAHVEGTVPRCREILTEAIGADTDEPTLHFVLGELYDKIGLKNLATEEYNEAEFLAKAKQ